MEQNKWVRDNLFDAQGNYVYCHSCILEHINIHSERLVHQRKIKCSLSKFPIVSMTKKVVVKQRLEKWVLASEGIDCSFKQYWKLLNDDSEVLVKYPHCLKKKKKVHLLSSSTEYRNKLVKLRSVVRQQENGYWRNVQSGHCVHR